MPKILITGNGFDLYYGLPTSYNDMMEALMIVENTEDLSISSFENANGNWKRIHDKGVCYRINCSCIKIM